MSLPPCIPLKEFGAVFMCAVSQDPRDIQFPIQTQAIERAERQIFVDFSSVPCPNLQHE